jgi:hypothetical protein
VVVVVHGRYRCGDVCWFEDMTQMGVLLSERDLFWPHCYLFV